jgi:hypothetical protein
MTVQELRQALANVPQDFVVLDRYWSHPVQARRIDVRSKDDGVMDLSNVTPASDDELSVTKDCKGVVVIWG